MTPEDEAAEVRDRTLDDAVQDATVDAGMQEAEWNVDDAVADASLVADAEAGDSQAMLVHLEDQLHDCRRRMENTFNQAQYALLDLRDSFPQTEGVLLDMARDALALRSDVERGLRNNGSASADSAVFFEDWLEDLGVAISFQNVIRVRRRLEIPIRPASLLAYIQDQCEVGHHIAETLQRIVAAPTLRDAKAALDTLVGWSFLVAQRVLERTPATRLSSLPQDLADLPEMTAAQSLFGAEQGEQSFEGQTVVGQLQDRQELIDQTLMQAEAILRTSALSSEQAEVERTSFETRFTEAVRATFEESQARMSTADEDDQESIRDDLRDALSELRRQHVDELRARCPESWANIVRRHFNTWDEDGDGFISMGEISNLIQDPDIQGADAAALDALYLNVEMLEEVSNDELGDESSGMTLDDLEAFEHGGAIAEVLADAGLPVSNDSQAVEAHHRWAGGAIAAMRGMPLFTDPSGAVDYRAAHQRSLGTCYFLAAVLSMASHDPYAIRDMIVEHEDGSYTVTFPGFDRAIHVSPITDAELGLHAFASDGLWLTVLEKAYVEARLQPEDADRFAETYGGSLWEGMAPLTDRYMMVHLLAVTPLETTREHLTAAMNEGRMVTANIAPDLLSASDHDQGLPEHHVYTIIAFDPASDMVTVRNPWGRTELAVNPERDLMPLGSPFADDTESRMRTRDGRDDGEFTLSLEYFDDLFTSICYEGG